MCRNRGRSWWMTLLLFLPLVSIAAGCSSVTGAKGFSFFPQGHKLSDDAKALRWANLGPLEIPRELQKQSLAPYVVEPGDVLLVQPSDLDSPVRLPGDQPILPDGTINLGRYGQLLVAGRTVAEIEGMVKDAVQLITKEPGFISVRLVSRQSKVFYVLGDVNAPGSFPLSGRETVLDAILAAGGLTDRASPNNIILSRPSLPAECRTVLPVCYRNIVQLGDTTTNYQIAPGDRIFVPSRTATESVFGERCEKAPCNGVHVPCPLPGADGGGGCALPPSTLDPTLSVRDPQPVFRTASTPKAQ